MTLVDGQQRVITLMLMIAAVRDLAAESDPSLGGLLSGLIQQSGSVQSRLRPHERFVEVLDGLMAGHDVGTKTSFEENYVFFRAQMESVSDWAQVWKGLRRLEHVMIELGPQSDAQQIFESLNSTGATLSDDELIHNYIHMGRGHTDQLMLERDVWVPIETATQAQLGSSGATTLSSLRICNLR